jgi:hypothetical protein
MFNVIVIDPVVLLKITTFCPAENVASGTTIEPPEPTSMKLPLSVVANVYEEVFAEPDCVIDRTLPSESEIEPPVMLTLLAFCVAIVPKDEESCLVVIAVAMLSNSVSKSDPLTILPALPDGRESFAVKFVVFV